MSSSLRNIVRYLPSFFLPFLLILAYGSPVQAGPINWKIAGPEGGQVFCFVSPDATGTLILAGCNGGVYKSTDAGEHWQYLPKSPPLVRFLAINPLNPDILYAGWINGVSKSSDGGRTWQLTLNSGYDSSFYIPLYSGRPPTGLAVDPVNPQNVYATFANTMGPHGSFCRSSDGGQTWNETTPPAYWEYLWVTYSATLYTIQGLAVDPFQPHIIYVSFSNDKFRSQDYGQTFWRVYREYSQELGGAKLYAEPDAQGVLYSYGNNTSASRSNDWGDHWFDTHSPKHPVAVISHQGLGWAVLAASGEGVAKGYYSPFTDPWTPFNYGLGNGLDTLATVLALHPRVPYGAFAGMASGVYRTDTMGNNGDWRPKNKGLTNAVVTCLAVAPDPRHTLYAGTVGGGIFKSSDRGKSWQAINQGLAFNNPEYPIGFAFEITALAVEWPNYFKIYAATNIGLFRSVDGGANWLPTTLTDAASSVITDPQVPGTVYAVTGPDYGYGYPCWRSTDAGQTWAPLAANSTGPHLVAGPTSFPIYSVGTGVKRLNAVGQNWEDLSGPAGAISLALDPRVPTTLYAGTYKNRVYKSIDWGAHWTQLWSYVPPFNFEPQRMVTAIAVDPTNSDVYVGLQNGGCNEDGFMPAGGIWKSCDGGQTWTDLGLSYRGVNAISLDPAKQAIYCGLANAGVAVATPGGAGTPAAIELLLFDH